MPALVLIYGPDQGGGDIGQRLRRSMPSRTRYSAPT